MFYTFLETPIGPLLLAGHGEALSRIGFPAGKRAAPPRPEWVRDDAGFKTARRQLTEYFDGRRTHFEVELKPAGTPFQLSVWQALQDIPSGTTISYGMLAQRIGRPAASRAVGAANGANPLPVIVPCHRVIGASGALTGFGGGVDTKQWLLSHERGETPPTLDRDDTLPLFQNLMTS